MSQGYSPEQLEKRASLLGLLGLSAGVHIAPNIAMKAVKSTDAGHRALTNTFSAGINHGRTGQKLHPNLNALTTYGIGPESMIEYHAGRALGKKLQNYGDEGSDFYLNALKRNVNHRFSSVSETQKKELMHTPLIGTVKRYLDGEGEGRINRFLTNRGVPEDAKMTLAQKAGNVAMLGGGAAVDPHLLMQPGISYLRKSVGQSQLGRNFMKKQFENGEKGVKLGKAKELATDLLVSPGALDPYRVGRSLSRNVDDVTRERLKPVVADALKAKKEQGSYALPKELLQKHFSTSESFIPSRQTI